MLIPHDRHKKGVVIEIKSIKNQFDTESTEKFVHRVNQTIANALQQIERNRYYSELLAHKISHNDIIKLAIVFVGKVPYANFVGGEFL
jgi:hypothetical protein